MTTHEGKSVVHKEHPKNACPGMRGGFWKRFAPLFAKLAKYGSIAPVSFAISVGGTGLLAEATPLGPRLAYLTALATAFVVNFALCRYYVFKGTAGNAGFQMAGMLAISLSFRTAEYAAFLLLYERLQIPYLMLVIIIQASSAAAKFVLLDRIFSFGGGKSYRAKETDSTPD